MIPDEPFGSPQARRLSFDRGLGISLLAIDKSALVLAAEPLTVVVTNATDPLENATFARGHAASIQLALTAAGHEVRFIAVPELSADVAEDLHKRLDSVSSPKVGGPVTLDLILGIWRVARRQ